MFLSFPKLSKINMLVGGLCGFVALTVTKLPLLSYVVYNTIYNKNIEEEKEEKEIEMDEIDWEKKFPRQEEDYVNAHKLAFSKLENKNNMVFDENFVIESLPFWGDTRLNYNKEKSLFEYYNDRSGSIPYKFLSSLARYYVVKYDCKELYVDIGEELEKSKHMLERYEKKKSKKISEENINKILIKQKIIKFKYMGSIKELNNKQNEKVVNNNKISFAEFKKLKK